MKKIAFSLIVTVALCNSNVVLSGSMGIDSAESNWTGFYLGPNMGYWYSQDNKVVTVATSSYINQTFSSGASNIANALAQVATNTFTLNADGFIGGGQVGYNYQFRDRFVLGFDSDFDGLTNSNNTFVLQKTVDLVDFDENYVGSLAVKQKINFLGTVRARLGYLYLPTLLIYGMGGFSYGNATLNTTWTANESIGPEVYPTIAVTQNSSDQMLPGWTAGGGAEWLFKSNWSVRIEYTYYNLNSLNAPITLSQINLSGSSPSLWSSVASNTALSISVGSVKVGINYHFG